MDQLIERFNHGEDIDCLASQIQLVFPPGYTDLSAKQEYFKNNIYSYAQLFSPKRAEELDRNILDEALPLIEAMTDQELIDSYGPFDRWSSRDELLKLAYERANYSYLDRLPNEIVVEIGLKMSISDLTAICRTNIRLNQLLCDNQEFWRKRYLLDFGMERIEPTTVTNWKEEYRSEFESYDIWSFGSNDNGQLGLGGRVNRTIPTQIPGLQAKQIAAGGSSSIIIDSKYNIWSFGANYDGQLGLGDNIDRTVPTRIPGLKAKQIATGGGHSLIIDLNDNIWSFGNNFSDQLGLGDNDDRPIPTQIPGLQAKQIAAGVNHSLIIDLNDNVWSFGSNLSGQLGLGNNTNRTIPTQIPGLKAKQISAGEEHSLVIDLNDNVWSFGSNFEGELGLGDETNRTIPTQIPGLKAKQISAGGSYSLIIDFDDNVLSFGCGCDNDILVPTQIPELKAKQIATENDHSLVIDLNDNVWSFGANDYGQLGLEEPIELPFRERHILDANVPTQIQGLKAKQIAAGRFHSLVLRLPQ